ncbi:polyprenyl diphosphate synthase [Alteromonas sp. ASW11-36]|uniref:Ditrans,polycis-undecaprenyl-diphosphate synthase ((2E,6E)-farnesyl-diphosphate specific) n=1 Tax=Alteromonas arenosi TaxID=3055817 RepID=A0ABT7SVL0_9ALTE|nr:polyprenyl diphosphate synthase [Alteromonas sp. ASW11-36]MDM7860211.1 polyprenyl diphosphate synthase [Alteromonas sp. ASW11-36]
MSASSTTESIPSSNSSMPQHVAIIMDGNGRWAKQKGKIRTFGHKAGVDAVRASVKYARTNGIKSLTLFAFSSENWKRPEEEVSVLMDLFNLVLNSEVKKLNKNQVRLRVIGDLTRFDQKLVDKIEKAEALTADNQALTLNIAANYGGRWDIVNAAKHVAQQVAAGVMSLDDITEERFDQHICMADLPPLDLLIRTGGEHRISNFLLWQCAYAEFYFTSTLWPDFDEQAFADAVADFSDRQRRFGLTGEQVTSSC